MPDAVTPASVELTSDGTLFCYGSWTVGQVTRVRRDLQHGRPADAFSVIDGSQIESMDTTGAWLLLQLHARATSGAAAAQFTGFDADRQRLLDYVATELGELGEMPQRPAGPTWSERFESHGSDLVRMLAFIGEAMIALWRAILHPGRIRWQELLDDVYHTGVNALPIVGLLSFLIGVVTAYQGAVQLRLYGADIYVADLVGYSMLRELAPLLAAILVCGRTGSAYTARIGTMKVREEIAALETIGVPPVELLVLPRLMSLVIVMPLLAVFADILSIFGGMVMASTQLGIGFSAFIGRLEEAITFSTFMIGVGKAPVFAAIIAIIGCYQGFKVTGSAESVGTHTTVSVVQSIFMVIVVDALFSILFSILGV